MTQPNDPQGNEPTPAPAPEEKPESGASELTNGQIKASPLFQNVTSELAALRAEKADREADEEAANAKAEQDSLAAKGDFESALKIKDEQLKTQQEEFGAELLQRDLRLELSNAGFKHQMFVKGAVADFTGTADDVSDYVGKLAADDANKMFLSAAQQRQTLPETPRAPGAAASMTLEEARRVAKESTNQDVRHQARMVIKASYDSGK